MIPSKQVGPPRLLSFCWFLLLSPEIRIWFLFCVVSPAHSALSQRSTFPTTVVNLRINLIRDQFLLRNKINLPRSAIQSYCW